MALIECEECGEDVSNKAASCPHCGAPVEEAYQSIWDRDMSGCGCLIIGGFTLGLILLFGLNDWGLHDSASNPEPANRNMARADQYYVRIGFFSEPGGQPLSPRCRLWIRGYGDIYPTQQSDWQFGGTVGPFPKGETQTLYFYPYYTHDNEGLEIKMPFRYSQGLSLTSPSDMITITVKPSTIEFFGTPIKNATGQFSWEMGR